MMILRLDELPNDICSESEEVFKYFKDLKVMMEGILDLNRRGSLPELEKATTITLLLRITLKYDVSGPDGLAYMKPPIQMVRVQGMLHVPGCNMKQPIEVEGKTGKT